jgi:hypothetical protein
MRYVRPRIPDREPVDTRFATRVEAAARKQWEITLVYTKPKPTGRNSSLLMSQDTHCSLGYILFEKGKEMVCNGAGAMEFLNDDPDPLRRGTLGAKTKAGFHVYYKDSVHWYGVPHHFDALWQAMPYLQGGNRVLVEYR